MNTLLFLGLGMQEILLIALIVLLLFGGKKIPELMRGLGKGVKSFKEGLNDVEASTKESKEEEKKNETPKYTKSTLIDHLIRTGKYNEDGTLDIDTYEAEDKDVKTGNIVNWESRPKIIKETFEDFHNTVTKPGDQEGQRVSKYDFDDPDSPFASYDEYLEAYNTLMNAETQAEFRRALSRFGIKDESNWVRSVETPVVATTNMSQEEKDLQAIQEEQNRVNNQRAIVEAQNNLDKSRRELAWEQD